MCGSPDATFDQSIVDVNSISNGVTGVCVLHSQTAQCIVDQS